MVAEHQTAGRGRLDRTWETPDRAALTFSVLLRPTAGARAVALAAAARRCRRRRGRCARPGADVELKWPNDVLLGESQGGRHPGRADRDAGGPGRGGRHRPQRLDHGRRAAGRTTATSLALEPASPSTAPTLLARCCGPCGEAYAGWLRPGGAAALRVGVRRRCARPCRRQRVRVELPGGDLVDRATAPGRRRRRVSLRRDRAPAT